MEVDAERLAVTSMRYEPSGAELVVRPGAASPLVVLSQVRGGVLVPLTLRLLDLEGSTSPGRQDSLQLRFRATGATGGDAGVAGSLTAAASRDIARVTWRLALHNESRGDLNLQVLFPVVSGLGLGDPASEALAFPHHAGDLTLNPVEAYASSRYLGFPRAGTRAEDGCYVREINYCGLASMAWMDYHRPGLGLYLGCHDPTFALTGVRSFTGGPRDPWMGFGFRRFVVLGAGGSWESPPFVMEVHEGDWHMGARIYREWISTLLAPPPDLPDMAGEYGLFPWYDFLRDGTVLNTFADIPRLYELGKGWGLRHFFIAGWNHGGFDCGYPDYHPALELGSPVELQRACMRINEDGGKVTFYLNARLFDTGLPAYQQMGQAWAIKGPDGSIHTEQYDTPAVFAVMCPAAEGWRAWLRDMAVWVVRAYGARGVYLDQLASAEPFPCYHDEAAAGHGLHDPGEYNRAYVRLLAETLAALKAEHPGAFLMIENCGDIYGQYVWASLAWNGALYDEHFAIYRYTFPEHRLVMMVHPRRPRDVGEDWELRRDLFYRDIERALLLGAVFWMAPHRRFGPRDEDLLTHARDMLKLRAAAAPLMATGRYLDREGMEVQGEIEASHWLTPNGDHLVVVGNRRGAGGTVQIDLPAPREVRFLGPGGAPVDVPWKRTDGGIRLSLRPSLPAVVAILSAEPRGQS